MPDPLPTTLFGQLAEVADREGAIAMLAKLAGELTSRRRWHALFDTRLLEARLALGLPLWGDVDPTDAATRDALDARSRAACLEVGWPLLEEGHVAAAWMYLRAAAEPAELSDRLEAVAEACSERDDEATRRTLDELVHVTLWEGVAPPLGLRLLIIRNGTCNAITAYDQAIGPLPPSRQRAAARVLVAHLHRELRERLRHDLTSRGVPRGDAESLPALVAAGGDDCCSRGPHVDVSHLHSVLRIARVCDDRETLRMALELADYARLLPPEIRYPGDGPFAEMADASRHFFAGSLGDDVEEAVRYFSRLAGFEQGAGAGDRDFSRKLAVEYLVVLLTRADRPAEALDIALEHLPRSEASEATTGLVPPLVQLAAAAEPACRGAFQRLLDACRDHADAVTFAQTITAWERFSQGNYHQTDVGVRQPRHNRGGP